MWPRCVVWHTLFWNSLVIHGRPIQNILAPLIWSWRLGACLTAPRPCSQANARCKAYSYPTRDLTISNHLKNHQSSWSNKARITLIFCVDWFIVKNGDWRLDRDTVEALFFLELKRNLSTKQTKVLPGRVCSPHVVQLWRKTIWKWCCCQNSQNMFPCGGFMYLLLTVCKFDVHRWCSDRSYQKKVRYKSILNSTQIDFWLIINGNSMILKWRYVSTI